MVKKAIFFPIFQGITMFLIGWKDFDFQLQSPVYFIFILFFSPILSQSYTVSSF